MNIMDRTEIVRLSHAYNSSTLTTEDVSKFLLSYCIEKGKDELLSRQFIAFIMFSHNELPLFIYVLGLYEREFTICKLCRPDKNKPGTRILVSVY